MPYVTGKISGFDDAAADKVADLMTALGKTVEEAFPGKLEGIDAKVYEDDGCTLVMELRDGEVAQDGDADGEVHFDIVCRIHDADEHKLLHMMSKAVKNSGLVAELDDIHKHMHHAHGHDHEHH
ncbi:MAG: hypothetical protein MJZ68_06080, partial [archaeon]|nr:hypothetical protein [archaeon]